MASSSKSKIYFFFEQQTSLRNRTALKSFIEALFRKEKTKLDSLNYIFCSDARLLEINRQYLEHDYYTDIITFELSAKNEPVQGEIYISLDRVRDNAAKLGESFSAELYRVIFHGALHLCGYRDKKPGEQKEMRQKENAYIQLYQKQ